MTPVTPIRTRATMIHRSELLIDIEVAQMEAILAYRFYEQTWNPIKRWHRKKRAKALHAKADQMLAEYRSTFKQSKKN